MLPHLQRELLNTLEKTPLSYCFWALPGAFSSNCLLPPSSKTCQGSLQLGNNSLLSAFVSLSLGLKGVILGKFPVNTKKQSTNSNCWWSTGNEEEFSSLMFWINSTLICLTQNQIVCPPIHVHFWNPSPPLSISSCYFFQSLELNQTCEPLNKKYWVLIKWRDYGRLKMAANTIKKWGLSPLPLTLHRLWDYFDQ